MNIALATSKFVAIQATTIQADGEIFSAPTTDITYRVLPKALQILVPNHY
jgi:diacylglycerol kinase family enzyme